MIIDAITATYGENIKKGDRWVKVEFTLSGRIGPEESLIDKMGILADMIKLKVKDCQ